MPSNPLHEQQDTHRAANSLRDIYIDYNDTLNIDVAIWTNLYRYWRKLHYSLVVLGVSVGACNNDCILLYNDYYIPLYIYDKLRYG